MSNQIAAQEESARETQAQRDEDVVYARDYAAIVASFQSLLKNEDRPLRVVRGIIEDCQLAWVTNDEALTDATFFADQWGLPALLRALAWAIEQPEHVVSDVVEHP